MAAAGLRERRPVGGQPWRVAGDAGVTLGRPTAAATQRHRPIHGDQHQFVSFSGPNRPPLRHQQRRLPRRRRRLSRQLGDRRLAAVVRVHFLHTKSHTKYQLILI